MKDKYDIIYDRLNEVARELGINYNGYLIGKYENDYDEVEYSIHIFPTSLTINVDLDIEEWIRICDKESLNLLWEAYYYAYRIGEKIVKAYKDKYGDELE